MLARSVADHLMASGNLPVHISGGIEGKEWKRMTKEENEGTVILGVEQVKRDFARCEKMMGSYEGFVLLVLSDICLNLSICFARSWIPV